MTEPDHIPQRIVDLAVAALKQEKHIACVGCGVLPPEKIARMMIAAVRTQVLDDRDATLTAVTTQAAEWAEHADATGWALSDHDAVVADCGRQLQALIDGIASSKES